MTFNPPFEGVHDFEMPVFSQPIMMFKELVPDQPRRNIYRAMIQKPISKALKRELENRLP